MKSIIWKGGLLLGLLIGFGLGALAQVESDEKALIDVKDGVSFQKDSTFLLNLRFRMQNRAAVRSRSATDLRIEAVEARVRRLRLRLDGYVLHRKVQYYIQLSFSRADQDLEASLISQIVRDAILYYTLSEQLYIGFGQSKLPGNRQRVTSSGNLQFADRSILNAAYNIDRDFGIFAYYSGTLGGAPLRLKTAISTGEGRNANLSDDGLAYTGRIEYLPFGKFTNNGDYSEGDLEHEARPRLSLAATWSFNHQAQRTGGQLGLPLPEARDLHTLIVDALLKYRGFALSTEYLQRRTDNPRFASSGGGDELYVPVGRGLSTQLSWVDRQYREVAFRVALLEPDEAIASLEPRRSEWLLGHTRYFNGHRIKVQGHLGYAWVHDPVPPESAFKNQWIGFFQVEFGI